MRSGSLPNRLPNEEVERASLLAELVKVTGYEDVPLLMSGETIEAIRDHLASRRRAEADIRRHGRLGAIWKDDGAVVEG